MKIFYMHPSIEKAEKSSQAVVRKQKRKALTLLL